MSVTEFNAMNLVEFVLCKRFILIEAIMCNFSLYHKCIGTPVAARIFF